MSALRAIVTAVASVRDGSAALEFKKKRSHSTGEGDRFEEHVLALVYLRCLRRRLIFQLSANNDDAGDFDDVVLVWGPEGRPEAHILFVQLKHKTSPKSMTIHRDTLLSEAPKSDFGLGRYCTSYAEISKSPEMDRATFVLLTNACLGDSSLSMVERQDVGSVPGLELLQAGGELYRLNPEDEQVWKAVRGNTRFVEHFYLLCQQRNSAEIVRDIYVELEELLGAGEQCRTICESLCKSIREWMNGESVCLTSGWSKWQALVDEYIRKEVTECRLVTTRLKYCNVAEVRVYVESCNPAWVRPPERGTAALSATKIHQALDNQTHIMVTAERVTVLRHQILRCWGPFCRWLVVVDDDRRGNCDIFSELETHIQNERRLVILSSREHNCFIDTCQSSDVSNDSWGEWLHAEIRLNGYGYGCFLQNLVTSVDALKSLVDGEPALLLALARLSQPLRMGQKLKPLPAYYTPRKLVDQWQVTDKFLSSLGLWDVCVTDRVSYESLSRKIGRHSVMNLVEIRGWFVAQPQIEWPVFVLTDNLQTVREECRNWPRFNIYILQISDDRWKILNSFKVTPRIQKYLREQREEQVEALDPHLENHVTLLDQSVVTEEFLSSLWFRDVCVVNRKTYELLSRKIGRHSVTQFERIGSLITHPFEFEWPVIVLTDNLDTVQVEYGSWPLLNIYILQVCDDTWKILYFSQQPDRIQKYATKLKKKQLKVLDTASKVVIVEGRPGVGKSMMLSHMAKEIKERGPDCWILRVDLLEFYAVFDESDCGESAAEDILKATLFNKGELGRLEYALLRHSLLQSSQVVCLVDGFDEVCPDYVDKCLQVLPLLAPHKGKLIVTTRPAPVRLLEARMGVLAHSLEPYSYSELQYFFKHHPSGTSIPPISELNKSLRDLLRIPLFAEMFVNLSQETTETYDILTLYEAFFQNKFIRLYKEKWGDNLSAPGKKREVEKARKRHEQHLMVLAVSVLLRSMDIQAIPSSGRDDIVDDLVKAGIVYEFADGKPAFLHRTFAEHFLAKWCFHGDGEQSRAVVYYEAYRNDTLEFFVESFDHRAVRGLPLLEAVLDDNEGKVRALLAEGADLRQRDMCGRSALHLAAAHSSKRSLPLLLNCRDVGRGMLSAEDGLLKWTPMRYAVEGGSWCAVKDLLEAGGDLRQLGQFHTGLHDPAELQCVFRQDGYQALYQHVFQLNNPSWKGERASNSVAVQMQFAASLISLNLPRDLIYLIRERAYQEVHAMVCRLLLCAYR